MMSHFSNPSMIKTFFIEKFMVGCHNLMKSHAICEISSHLKTYHGNNVIISLTILHCSQILDLYATYMCQFSVWAR
jgi:hypothetical protein